MPLQAPNLDDRRFADLVAEAKSRIPRYLPEWTDHNTSDPGITLIQLFAWLGEMIMYRLNQVPDLNYIKFLQLIGIERKPAAPARAELTFTLANPGAGSVLVPQGTQVSAQVTQQPSALASAVPPPDNEPPLVFETDEPLYAIGAALQNIQVFDGVNFVDYTEANQPGGKSFPAFGTRARDDSAVMLGFNADAQFPTVEINLAVRVFIDPLTLQDVSCEGAAAKAHPPARVVWEYWGGSSWEALQILKDETRALTASGHLYFIGPKDIKQAKLGKFTQPTDKPMYWIRCHLLQSEYELAPELDAVLVNTVRATAVATIRDEVVGSSDGLPDQIFALRNSPIYAGAPFPVDARLLEQRKQTHPPNEAEQAALDKALRERELRKGFWLELDEGQGFKPWDEVEDFFNSSAEDRHYILNRATGEVTFGNGERGAIPVAGVNNIIARYYRYGGGARGNVGPTTITEIISTVVGIDSVTNSYLAEGGADEEKIADTKARAPKEIKARDRAVTAQDFEFIARQTPGVRVRRAHALPLYHPQFPGVQVPGAITVVIIPESADPKPMPSEGTMQTVCEYLNQRRLLTNEVFVAPPRYKQVKIEATVISDPAANPVQVKTEIENALTTYLHPLDGGADGQGWPMGGDVLYSEIFRVVLNIEGVQTIKDLRIIVDGARFGRCEDASIDDDFLVFSDGHDITVTFTPGQT
jgi:predicted phage baseplate assembly protein